MHFSKTVRELCGSPRMTLPRASFVRFATQAPNATGRTALSARTLDRFTRIARGLSGSWRRMAYGVGNRVRPCGTRCPTPRLILSTHDRNCDGCHAVAAQWIWQIVDDRCRRFRFRPAGRPTGTRCFAIATAIVAPWQACFMLAKTHGHLWALEDCRESRSTDCSRIAKATSG
jgi:hypothetical protein